MKRLLTILMALMLLVPSAYAAEIDSLQNHAIKLADRLDLLASSDAYVSAFTSADNVRSLIAGWAAGEHGEPAAIYAADLYAYEQLMEEQLRTLPDSVRLQQVQRIPQVLIQIAMNQEGASSVAASAIARASSTFSAYGVTGRGLYILTYGNAWPVAVSWYADDNAVSMTATFLPNGLRSQLPDSDGGDFMLTIGDVTVPCGAAEPIVTEAYSNYAAVPRLDQVLRLAKLLHVMAEDEVCLELIAVPENVAEVVSGFAPAEYVKPRLAAEADTTDTVIVSGRVGVNADYNSVAVTETLNARRIQTTLAEQVGREGVDLLSGVSSLQVNRIYADKSAKGAGMYVFLFEDAAPIIALWSANAGAYEVTAFFHPLDELDGCQTIDDINAWSEQIGLELNFEQIADDRLK